MANLSLRLAGLARTPTAWFMLALVVLSFLQRPGRTTFDTKLDLVVDPWAFLGRALHLWNPQATGGELQNQAYGYLFPMGPFFALADTIGLPPWITQRIWCALLLCLAFGGMLLLARALRIGSEPARYAGALAYALAPRMLTEIGPVSAEMLPAALLPWIMLPLVRAGKVGSPRRAALLSALAVLCIGGVNGAMVVMVLVLPVLWLLTREWTRRHVQLTLWWGAGVLAATLWWILPLLLLGQYSLPFLDYIESASNTTAPMSLFQALRGTNQWVAYVVFGEPWWPSGFLLIDNPLLMLATGLVAAVGLAGLVRPNLPERAFLTLGVLVGAALLTIGFVGTLDSPLAGAARELLDGPLAPLRNVHKFEPGLRLPLLLAFIHAVSGRLAWLARTTSVLWATRARLVGAFLLVAIAAAPAWLLTLRPGPGWEEVPGYWRSAMTWLGRADPNARTLLLPASGFGEYTWGRTIDEPAQALARAPWAVRSQIPLGSEGNTRVMDAVEEALASGRGAPGLADFLARAGYRYLLLRNDIDRAVTAAPPPGLIRAGLAASPWIAPVAGFGPLEIFEVQRPVSRVLAVSTQDAVTVSGGPESVLPLLDNQLITRDHPVVLAGDGGVPEASRWLVTDGLRYRERNVGLARNNLSQTMTPEEPTRQDRPAVDVLPFQGIDHQTVAAFRGVRTVTAATAASFADAVRGSEPSHQPFAALDGDPLTAWHSSSFTGPAGQWLEVELDTPRPVGEVTLSLVDDLRVGWPVTRVRITTDAGTLEHDVEPGPQPQVLAAAPGLTSRVRVTVLAVAADRQDGNVGIAELTIPGVTPSRALKVPADATPARGQRTSFAFTRGAQPRYPCMAGRCDVALARYGEEPDGIHRLFATTSAANYWVAGTVLPALGGRNPVSLDGFEVSASSQLAGDPAAGPLAALDGDPATTWIADVADPAPTLRLKWPGQRTITGVRLSTADDSGALRPSELDIRTPAGNRTVQLDDDGRASFSVTTDQVEIAVTEPAGEREPPGITDIELSGVDDLAPRLDQDTRFTVPCGAGPRLIIDDFSYDTTVSGSYADIIEHRPLLLGTCRDLQPGVDLRAGEHELRTERSDAFVVQDLWLTPDPAAREQPQYRTTAVRQWDSAHRRVDVGPGPAAVLSVPENANDGWVATVDGRELPRTRVDGWQQAWLLPAGQSVTVHLDFVPDSGYRTRLLIGALAAAALVIAVALPVRRRPEVIHPGGLRWIPVPLFVILALLGGMLPVVLLIACLLVRALWRPGVTLLAFGGMALATVIAAGGRVLGYGQEWAYGTAAQAGVLLALAAVVAGCVDWFDRPQPQ